MVNFRQYISIFALCGIISIFLASDVFAQKRTFKPAEMKARIEAVLGGEIKGVVEFREKQSPKDNPKVILVIERKGIKSKEVIQSIFDKDGRLISIRNLSLSEGKAAGGSYQMISLIGGDAVDCRNKCDDKCSDPFCYAWCWYMCVLR